jgi:hypothetical protein
MLALGALFFLLGLRFKLLAASNLRGRKERTALIV